MQWRWGCAVAGVLLATQVAKAHELSCDKEVKVEGNNVPTFTGGGSNYSPYGVVDHFPATLQYKLTVHNIHDSSPSEVLGVDDPLLEYFGFSFDPATPFWIPYNESVSDYFSLYLGSYEECLRIARNDGSDDEYIDNVMTVTWEDDNASCSARVKCVRPEEPEKECRETRTIGFYGTHPKALEECLDGGNINLGFLEIDSLEDALGLLWGSPAKFENGKRRDGVDKHRFLLGRQLLAAICNGRLFHSYPTGTGLIEDARIAAEGLVCADMEELKNKLDRFNNSGECCKGSRDWGRAEPQRCRDTADDPTTWTGDRCVRNNPSR